MPNSARKQPSFGVGVALVMAVLAIFLVVTLFVYLEMPAHKANAGVQKIIWDDAAKFRCMAATVAMIAEIERGGRVKGLETVKSAWDKSPYGSRFSVLPVLYGKDKEQPWAMNVIITTTRKELMESFEIKFEAGLPGYAPLDSQDILKAPVKRVRVRYDEGLKNLISTNSNFRSNRQARALLAK